MFFLAFIIGIALSAAAWAEPDVYAAGGEFIAAGLSASCLAAAGPRRNVRRPAAKNQKTLGKQRVSPAGGEERRGALTRSPIGAIHKPGSSSSGDRAAAS